MLLSPGGVTAPCTCMDGKLKEKGRLRRAAPVPATSFPGQGETLKRDELAPATTMLGRPPTAPEATVKRYPPGLDCTRSGNVAMPLASVVCVSVPLKTAGVPLLLKAAIVTEVFGIGDVDPAAVIRICTGGVITAPA